jgi:hypothetical protein
MLARSGDITTAVSLVRNSIKDGVEGNAGDYADQIAVLNQAGLTQSANPDVEPGATGAVRLLSLRGSAMAT